MSHSIFKRRILTGLAACAAMVASAGLAAAAPITPSFGSFGSLPSANWGGSGLPNNAVATTTIQDGDNTITLGLAALARYYNPLVTNNGAGDYYATIGINDGLEPGNPHALGATWNIGWYVKITGGGTIADYDFSLLYDLDAGAGTDAGAHGTMLEPALFSPLLATVTTSESQASQNMQFGFWSTSFPGAINPPVATFNGNVPGEYTFSLRTKNNAGGDLGQTSVRVNVNTVPEPGVVAMIGMFLLSLAGFAWRRRSVRS